MGRGVVTPIDSYWSASIILEHLGEPVAARALLTAPEQVTPAGEPRPRDLGGQATTREVTDAVLAAIEGQNLSS